jgi:glycosyltransferase involved in cell wall biosynthesis
MRIVHVMNWYIPNLGYQENFLPAEQKKLGHQVEIITSDRTPPLIGFSRHVGRLYGRRIFGEGITNDNGVRIHRLRVALEIENGGMIVLKGLNKKLKELNPDVVHAHGAFTPSTIQVVANAERMGYRVFIDEHTHSNNFNPASLSKTSYIQAVRVFYRILGKRVDGWMPVTDAAKEILQSLFVIRDTPIQVLDLGADTNRFRPSEDLRMKGRQEVGIGSNELLVITAGKFDETKDTHVLIKAFREVVSRNPGVRLLLLGDGPESYMQMLHKLVEDNQLEHSVIFHVFVRNEELPKFYNAADIGAWPGNHTITAVEAFATGLPVIIPDSDKAYAVLFKSGAVYGYARGDVSSLVHLILQIITDADQRRRKGLQATRFAADNISWQVLARRSIDMYSSATRSNVLEDS